MLTVSFGHRGNSMRIDVILELTTARSIDSVAELKEILDVIAQEVEASVVFDLKPPEQSVHDAARRSQQILDVE